MFVWPQVQGRFSVSYEVHAEEDAQEQLQSCLTFPRAVLLVIQDTLLQEFALDLEAGAKHAHMPSHYYLFLACFLLLFPAAVSLVWLLLRAILLLKLHRRFGRN